jgi:hypothetical protein
MKHTKRVMRFDTRDYDIGERIKVATQNTKKRQRMDAQQGGAAEARERMIARQARTGPEGEPSPIREYEKKVMGASQKPLTPGEAYELFTKGSGAKAARERMIARQLKQGRV